VRLRFTQGRIVNPGGDRVDEPPLQNTPSHGADGIFGVRIEVESQALAVVAVARAAELDSSAPVAAICAGGYRSSIATSLLERAGFRRITNVVGGMTAWNGAGLGTV